MRWQQGGEASWGLRRGRLHDWPDRRHKRAAQHPATLVSYELKGNFLHLFDLHGGGAGVGAPHSVARVQPKSREGGPALGGNAGRLDGGGAGVQQALEQGREGVLGLATCQTHDLVLQLELCLAFLAGPCWLTAECTQAKNAVYGCLTA